MTIWTRLRRLRRVLSGAAYEWNEDKAPRMAAALAFYTVFSLAPIVIIAVTVAGMVFGRDAALSEVYQQARLLVGNDGVAAIRLLVEHAPARPTSTTATIVGLATMFFAATGAFTELKDSLNTIWEVQPKPGLGIWEMAQARFLSFALVLIIGFFMVVSLMASAMLAAVSTSLEPYSTGAVAQFGHRLISFVLIMLLFALIFKVMPDALVSWRDVWLGAATTALLSALGKWLFGLYLGHSSIGAGYGAAGSLVIVVLWTYYSSLILLFGAEITQVQAKLAGEPIIPAAQAVHVTEHTRIQEGRPHHESVVQSLEDPPPATDATRAEAERSPPGSR
ncbi:MAG: YihY/virulence factor BrkB family protein [Planctomycetaceae bacterium]|nr:YihY/virulence factor BrkB family protein [Planctomycetaceae bacterium]